MQPPRMRDVQFDQTVMTASAQPLHRCKGAYPPLHNALRASLGMVHLQHTQRIPNHLNCNHIRYNGYEMI